MVRCPGGGCLTLTHTQNTESQLEVSIRPAAVGSLGAAIDFRTHGGVSGSRLKDIMSVGESTALFTDVRPVVVQFPLHARCQVGCQKG